VKLTKELQDLLGEIHDCDVQIPHVQQQLTELVGEDTRAMLASATAQPTSIRRSSAPPRTAAPTQGWWR
jgi:CHAD domain-containing protein